MNTTTNLGQLYEEFRGPLKSFIKNRVADESTAEDLLHDVFLRIHNQIGSLRDKEKIQQWIYRITRNAIIDFYKSKKQTVLPSEEELPAIELETLSDVSEKLSPLVQRMIDKLPDKYREPLLLSDFQGVKLAEIAERLDISLPGVKSRVQRARKMVKDLLLECCHFEFDRYGTVFGYSAKNCTQCCGQQKSGRNTCA